jgi:hypothetical protein
MAHFRIGPSDDKGVYVNDVFVIGDLAAGAQSGKPTRRKLAKGGHSCFEAAHLSHSVPTGTARKP